jgi:ribosomal protein S27E
MTNRITKTTRAPRTGRAIVCPHCSSALTVYHFAWSALVCPACGQATEKRHWLKADS